MKRICASIITIGDELLIGQVIDTNSSTIARKLNAAGIIVKRRLAIPDEHHDIYHALNLVSEDSQVVLITGGLGPTNDDVTKDALCQYFEGKLIVNEEAEKNVRHLFEKIYQKPVTPVNLSQALVPDVCKVIQNRRGSAPGMVFQKDGVVFISMPGVPYEMEGILEEAIPMLQKRFSLPAIVHKTLLTAGIGESALAEKIASFESNLPESIRLAYLPNYGMVRLRLSSVVYSVAENEAIEKAFKEVRELVKEYLVTDEDESMQVVVGNILKETGRTVSTAESCTGGNIAALLTSIAGSSAYFEGSVVSYSNRIKEEVLGVKKQTLNDFGAVSEETVKEMLSGLLAKMSTDVGIAVSGIMGPGGGSEEKPVGTMWMAVGNAHTVRTKKILLRYARAKNIEVASVSALNFLRLFLLETDGSNN